MLIVTPSLVSALYTSNFAPPCTSCALEQLGDDVTPVLVDFPVWLEPCVRNADPEDRILVRHNSVEMLKNEH